MILLADDDPADRKRVCALLDDASLSYHATDRAADLLALAPQLRPDLVILACGMPAMDERELGRRMRTDPRLARTPLLLLARPGAEEATLQRTTEALGAAAWIAKPLEPAMLLARVRELLTANLPPAPEALPVGATLAGRFRIERELGSGGMSAVYLACDLEATDDALVALKTLRPGGRLLEELTRARARMRREIDAVRQLRHPQLIRLHEGGALPDGMLYFTMDYHPRPTLAARLASDGALPAPEALELAIKLAQGLEHAHSHGILHRDVKPDNVLFDAAGEPVLTDFGLMLKYRDRAGRMTGEGLLVGTPHYMSPEQILQPSRLDPRSDVFSLGVLLFEVLTGRTPLAGLADIQAMYQIALNPLPTPSELGLEMAEPLADLLIAAMAHDRDQRLPTARAFAEAAADAMGS